MRRRADASCLSGQRSNADSNISMGPSVIIKYNNEGGYLVVFRKESTVKSPIFCENQGAESPYPLTARKRMKVAMRIRPQRRVMRLRSSGFISMNGPKA